MTGLTPDKQQATAENMPRCDFCGDATNAIAAWEEGLVCDNCEDLARQTGWNPNTPNDGRKRHDQTAGLSRSLPGSP